MNPFREHTGTNYGVARPTSLLSILFTVTGEIRSLNSVPKACGAPEKTSLGWVKGHFATRPA
jgi:hypothetical protein